MRWAYAGPGGAGRVRAARRAARRAAGVAVSGQGEPVTKREKSSRAGCFAERKESRERSVIAFVTEWGFRRLATH